MYLVITKNEDGEQNKFPYPTRKGADRFASFIESNLKYTKPQLLIKIKPKPWENKQ